MPTGNSAMASDGSALPAQAIPRLIHQTGFTLAGALRIHDRYMAAWRTMNPEYDYTFYPEKDASDDDRFSPVKQPVGSPLRVSHITTQQRSSYHESNANTFVAAHADAHERAAWQAVRTGAQRADLFRLFVLRYVGGVYADVDTELRRPLRETLPANASAVLGLFWGSEFMAFAPGHPLLVRALRTIVGNVHRQVRSIAAGNTSSHCGSPHSCVLMVTGPYALRAAFSAAATAMGCRLRGRGINSAKATSARCPEAVRRTHVCTSDSGNVYRTWACGAAYHWDCRNSGAQRACGPGHYSKHRRGPATARAFFNASVLVSKAHNHKDHHHSHLHHVHAKTKARAESRSRAPGSKAET